MSPYMLLRHKAQPSPPHDVAAKATPYQLQNAKSKAIRCAAPSQDDISLYAANGKGISSAETKRHDAPRIPSLAPITPSSPKGFLDSFFTVIMNVARVIPQKETGLGFP
ncbi:hypothetical protein PT974_04325 [Cladobotryum mycophilum]|uniref:Uncharacterized protein n=1 Tax=Cladobotryum mycophilum TaxID=491253 RepID=A0ABR0SUS1_9HYPO